MFPFFNNYPGTDLHEIDLAYILKLCAELRESNTTLTAWKATHEAEYAELADKVDGLINNLVDVIVPWDSSTAYHIFSIVEYQGTNYIAVQDVPIGTMITNTEYWQPAQTVVEQINAIGATVTELVERFDIFVTPQMYGAAADGETDDTAAFQSMFDSNTDETVLYYIPHGTYKIAGDVIVTNPHINIMGGGMYTSIVDFVNTGSIEFTATNEIGVDGIQIKNQKYIKTSGHHIQFRNCKIYNGIEGLHINDGYIVQILNCYITFNKIGVLLNNQSFETVIDACVIDNNEVGVIVGGVSTGAIIKNSTIEGNRNRTSLNGCGICLNYTVGSLTIDSCWFEANGTSQNSCDIFYVGVDYDSNLTALFNEISALFTLTTGRAVTGNVNISNNKFNYTKYGINISGWNSNTSVSRNSFSGVKDKNNVPIKIAGRNLLVSKLFAYRNIIINTQDPSITTEMTTGINDSYIYTDLTPASSEYEALSGTDYITLDNKPLYNLVPTENSRIVIDNSSNSEATTYTLSINSNTAFLYMMYDTIALISCNYQVTSAPVRALYGTAPTVTPVTANRELIISIPAYKKVTLLF